MASAHVPFFLDGKPFMRFRGRPCWDGSFPDFVYFDNSEYIKRDGKVCICVDPKLSQLRGDSVGISEAREKMPR
jgi:hypothetical protein